MTLLSADGEELKGISGWLLLSAAGLVFGTTAEFLVLALVVSQVAQAAPEWSGLTIDPFWTYWAVTKAVLVALALVAVVSLLGRRRQAPRLVVALLALTAIQLVGQTILASYGEHAAVVQLSAALTVVGLANAAIWIPYYLVSKRVAATFLR